MTIATSAVSAAVPAKSTTKPPKKSLPKPNSDFYRLSETIPPDELALIEKLRSFLSSEVEPLITKYWAEDAFPFEILPGFRALNMGGLGLSGYGCTKASPLTVGFAAMELARVDASIATFYGVHNHLALGSIYVAGSQEQKEKWIPPMVRMEKIGCFALTEPLCGSGAARGLQTTARRDGDSWVLNGQKKWIGNAPWCDVSIIWARDVADDQVKGFIVENKTTPGFSVEKIKNKVALRIVQNGLITLKDCRIPEENHLQEGKSFKEAARVLRVTRFLVGWESTGVQMGAYEAALAYAQSRLQFGRPIASFQMMQDLLARMLENITACQCMMARLAQMQAEHKLEDQHAAVAKAFTTTRMRETVSLAREMLGANGIVLENKVARFVADSEALYSYEGTLQIQRLIVGRAITGFSAFVDGGH